MKLLKTMTSLALLLGAPAAWAIPTALQDFEDGTTQGWTAGGGPLGAAPPVLPALAAGGPGGPADHFLRIVSGVGAGGSGSNLVAINRDAWDGDYLAAGLTSVTADLRNFGSSDLYIRLLVIDAGNNRIASTGAVFLPAGGDWTAGAFSLAAGDLLAGLGAMDDLLQSVTELRIWGTGDPNAVFSPGDNRQNAVSGVLGVDRLTPDVFGNGGGVVPAPATAWLALLGLLRAGGARRWRRH